MIRLFFSVFLLSICLTKSALVYAQTSLNLYADTKTDKWTVRSFENDPLNVRVYTFNNGLQLITSKQLKEPRIYTMIAVKTGSANDPADHTGLAHYLEHMLFKGTDLYGTSNWSEESKHLASIEELYNSYNKTIDDSMRLIIYTKIDSVSQLAAKYSIANEYDKMCQAMGASGTNAFTSKDQTCYINDIPSNKLHQWITLESERFRNPIFRLFHTELEAVYEEKNISLDDDNSKVRATMDALLYPGHPYGTQTTIGTIEHLKNPSLPAIRDYYKKYYVPNNMAVIMCGDFDPDVAADAVAEHFKFMKPQVIEPKKPELMMPYGRPKVAEIIGKNAESVSIAYRVERTNPKNESILKVIDLLLSNSSSGFIDINLNLSQKVQSAYSQASVNNDYCALKLVARPKKGQSLEEAKNLLLEQIDLIKNGSFDEVSLKANILNSDIQNLQQFESNSSRAFFLMDAFISEKGYRRQFNQLDEMSKISKEEIRAFSQEFLTDGRVEVYKRQGEDNTALKIAKPTINPVELNRDKQSDFVKEWLTEKSDQIEPQVETFERLKETVIQDELKLYYVKNDKNRLFNMSYYYEQGTYHNLLWPYVLNYLELCGSESKSPSSIQTELYNLGCTFYTSVNNENMSINIEGPEENFTKAISIIEDLLNQPQLNSSILDGLIEKELKNRTNAKLNPRAVSARLLSYSMYGPLNPQTNILSKVDLKRIKAENMVKYIKSLRSTKHVIQYYGPGDIQQVTSRLKGLHPIKSFAKNPTPSTFELRDIKKPEVLFTHFKQVQASIYWFNTSYIYTKDKATLSNAFNTYFGGDMSSVVFQSIRESKALAYSTSARQRDASKKGAFNYNLAFIGTQADKFTSAVEGMNDLISSLPEDEATFELSKQSIENGIRTRRENPKYLFYLKKYYEKIGLEKPLTMQMLNEINGIKMKNIKQFHKKYWSKKPFSLSVVGNKNLISKERLNAYGKLSILSLEDIFGY